MRLGKDSDWSREAIVRAKFLYSQVLRQNGQQDQADVPKKAPWASARAVLGENAIIVQMLKNCEKELTILRKT